MRIPVLPGLVAALPLLAVPNFAADAAKATRRVQAHATFLADDLLEGRGTGTRGYALAVRYVATQFARLGLEPGGDGGGYEQPMRFLESTNQLEAGRLVVRHDGREDSLVPINDMIASPNVSETSASVTAPAVFVGFGVQAPDLGYDDFAGVDLKGKIAVVLQGAPKRFPSTQRAHHTSTEQKRMLAVKHGAVGLVIALPPWEEAIHPWAVAVARARFPAMRLLDAAGAVVDGYPELRATAAVNRTATARLLAASGHTAEEVFAKADRGEPQAFDLQAEFTLGGEATLRTVASANVLGWLPGTDPALARQPIVVTAHLDHLGIGAAVNGDTIYNGAMDNAIGIGIVLAAAEELATAPRAARPVLFAALTGEEKGLLGAVHLSRNPPARVEHFAANVNVDMPLFMAPVRSIIAWGAEHTTLGPIATAAAARDAFAVTPDPMPEETIFIRSDQYPFVKSGVPSIYLSSGQQSPDPSVDLRVLWTRHLRERYHKPSDDLNQPIDWPSAGAFAGLVTDILRDVANDPQAPAWLPGDFFGGLFGPNRK
ncbi:MAG TPA: M28 family peptidase [Lacunisphaera sp.]|nr:M28 family peptidase [Lacunisphaera sp.]